MQKTWGKALTYALAGNSPSTLLALHAHETFAPNTKPQLKRSCPIFSKGSGRIQFPGVCSTGRLRVATVNEFSFPTYSFLQ